MRLSEALFQVVYTCGLWSRFSGFVKALVRYGKEIYICTHISEVTPPHACI